jgi:hypothetical protein
VSALLRRLLAALALTLVGASAATAQPLQVHGFFDVGGTSFTAKDAFRTVLGSSSAIVFGGGGGVVLPMRVFVDVRASRFRKNGRRVFVFNNEVFDLGIDDTVTITPLQVTAGYRFGRQGVVPYAGGGIGWYRYQETDPSSLAGDDVDQRFIGYHATGGAEIPIVKWLAIAGEAEWSSVRTSVDQMPNSAMTAFGENDLGGLTFRVKAVVGR